MSGIAGYRTLAQASAGVPGTGVDGPTVGASSDRATPSGAAPDAYGTGAGNWGLPFLPLTLPTPSRVARDGKDLLAYHPRDPRVRIPAERPAGPPSGSRAAAPATGRADERASTGASGGSERAGSAKAAMMVGIGVGLAQNGVDVARTIKKYPEALRAGRFDPSLGRLGRLPTALALTAMTRPDARLIDPKVGRLATVANAGKSFTRVDEIAMKTSVMLGTSLAGVQLISAVPNLIDAVGDEGPWHENLLMSTSGRAGVLQLAGGSVGLGLFVKALQQTRAEAEPGIIGRALAAGKAPVMAKPFWTTFGLATGGVVIANELGYFDALNRGEERPVGTVLRDAANRTPVLNDSAYRTAAILTAGSVVGYKAHRAIATAGGFGGLTRGHAIGGAVVAGLLGAQLLGGLDSLNGR